MPSAWHVSGQHCRQHSLHPNLLSRWVKERQVVNGLSYRKAPPLPQFVPVRIDSDPDDHARLARQSAPRVEVNIDRGELRIQFKVDSTQMVELGQVLREVLR